MSLYLRISDTEICFARYDGGSEAVFEFEKYHLRPQVSLTVNLREAMERVELLKQPFADVHVFVKGAVTPVPLAEFQEEDAESTYGYCFAQTGKARVFYDTVPACNIVLLFSLEEATCRALEETFGQVRYTSSLTPLLQCFASKAAETAVPRRVFVYTHEQALDVCVFEENRLLMLNTFKVNTLSDADYYLFNLVRHLGMKPEDAALYVVGEESLMNPLADELRHYAPQVYTVNPAADFNRHTVATTEGVPYDMICGLLK